MLSSGPDRMDVTECDCGTCPGCEMDVARRREELPCAKCHQHGKVTTEFDGWAGFIATCDCYDGAPVHSGDDGPTGENCGHGRTKAEAIADWRERNEELS